MLEDLERIRILEGRMRKKPTQEVRRPEDQEKSLNKAETEKNPRENKIAEGDAIKKLAANDVGQQGVVFKASDEEQDNKPTAIIEERNNRKLTDYFPRKRANNKAQKMEAKQQQKQQRLEKTLKQTKNTPIDNTILELQKQLSQKQQIEQTLREKLTNCQTTIEQNRLLREKVKTKQEQFSIFKRQVKQKMLSVVIENHRLKRNQLRSKISNNKIRLGQFVTCRENGKTQQLWVDGFEIRNVKEKLEQINNQKQELEKQKKNIKPKKGQEELESEAFEKKNSITCQIMMLTKEQSHLKDHQAKLQEQKILHMKEYKMMFEQDHSKYGRPHPQTGIVNWPKIGHYQLLCLLGKGGFSEVYKSFDTEQLKEAACKIHQFSPSWSEQAKQNYIKHALRENTVHKHLKHPNIVRLYNTVQIDNTSFCTVLEYCDGPDLSYYLKKYKTIQEKQAKLLIRQVMNAIKYLHTLPQKVIHYDLKPQNILFHCGQIKITDFGLCKILNDETTKMELTSQGVGTYWYLPPQCFFVDQRPTISTKVDIWSIGVIYYEMLFGQKPFGQKMSQMRILKEGVILKSAQVQFPSKPNNISQESKDFIKACLMYKEQDRPDIIEALNHPLFEKK